MKVITSKASLVMHVLLVMVVFGAAVTDARAGDEKRRGTAGAQQLLVPLTARYASLGGSMTAGMANMNGLEMLYSNAAGLTLNQGTSVLFSRMEYVADIGVNYFGFAQRIGNNQLAFTINAWDFGDIPMQTEENPEITDVTFDISLITAGASYARQFTDRIAAGTTVKLISETYDDVGGVAVAFDAGMTYTVGESGLRLGVSLNNIGSDLNHSGTGMVRHVRIPSQNPASSNNALQLEGQSVELPSMLNFGMSYSRDVGAGSVVTLLGNFRSNSFDQDQYSGGLELGFRDLLFVRGGFEMAQDMDLTFYSGANFGAGLNLDLAGTRVAIDYAYRGTEFFDAIQMFTASVEL